MKKYETVEKVIAVSTKADVFKGDLGYLALSQKEAKPSEFYRSLEKFVTMLAPDQEAASEWLQKSNLDIENGDSYYVYEVSIKLVGEKTYSKDEEMEE
jgi:hypothetical protein